MKPKALDKLLGKSLEHYPVFITLFLLLFVLNLIGLLLNYDYFKYGPLILSCLYIFAFSLQSYLISRQQFHLNKKTNEVPLNSILYGIIISDPERRITQINHVGCEILGINPEDAISLQLDDPLWEVVDRNGKVIDTNNIPISVAINTCKPVKKEIVGTRNRGNQKTVWLEVSANPVLNKDEQIEEVVLVFSEVTEQLNSIKLLSERNEQLRQLSFTDYIVDIPNRRYLNSYLTKLWLDSKKSGTPITLFLIEIDYTKEYKIEHDYTFSDFVLIEVSKKLCEAVNQQGVVTRVEGNQFAIIYSGLFGKQIMAQKQELKNKLYMLTEENRLESHINDFTVFIGMSTRTATDHSDYNTLLEDASNELNQAKISIIENVGANSN